MPKPKIIELKDVTEYPPTLLKKDKNGLYPYPTMRCGVYKARIKVTRRG